MRWKRLIRCAGGLRCGDVVVANLGDVPPGGVVHIEYTCEGCGTHYTWNSRTGEREAIDHLSNRGTELRTLEPGESTTVEVIATRDLEI